MRKSIYYLAGFMILADLSYASWSDLANKVGSALTSNTAKTVGTVAAVGTVAVLAAGSARPSGYAPGMMGPGMAPGMMPGMNPMMNPMMMNPMAGVGSMPVNAAAQSWGGGAAAKTIPTTLPATISPYGMQGYGGMGMNPYMNSPGQILGGALGATLGNQLAGDSGAAWGSLIGSAFAGGRNVGYGGGYPSYPGGVGYGAPAGYAVPSYGATTGYRPY